MQKAAGTCAIDVQAARSPADYRDVGKLFRRYAEWLSVEANFPDLDTEIADLPTRYCPPTGALLLARNGQGWPVGCVALRALSSNQTCELKRLFVLPAARQNGAGRLLLGAALCFAEDAGYQTVVLDTLPTMTAAIRLYRSFGFGETSAYYASPGTDALYFRKEFIRDALKTRPTDG